MLMDHATPSQNLHVPPTPLIHLYTLYTDLEWRGQIKKDRFPVSSLLLMSLLLSHLLSLFFCCLKFDFHNPSPLIFPPPFPPPYLPDSLSHPQSLPLFKVRYIRSPLRQKTRVILEIHVSYCFLLSFFFFYIISTFILMSVSNLHWQVVHTIKFK